MNQFYQLLTKIVIILVVGSSVCFQEKAYMVEDSEMSSPKNIEIELRYKILDQMGLQQFIASLAFVNKEHIIDIYLDTNDANLLERGIYIRLRNNQKLDIKFNRACLEDPMLEYQPYCEEHSFKLPLMHERLPEFNDVISYLGLQQAQTFEEFKARNNFIDHRIIDKVRSTYTHEDFVIVIDEVKDLGTFLEIEIMTQNVNQLDAITQQMQEILSPLKLERLIIGTEALVLRKQNFQHYLKSRFIHPEDKERYGLGLPITSSETDHVQNMTLMEDSRTGVPQVLLKN